MRYLLTSIFTFLLSVAVYAQRQAATDSIFVYHQAVQNLQAAKWGATQLVNSEIEKASALGLVYNLQQGPLRQAQQAEQTSRASFEAEGISTIDRFKLYGYFSFTRIWQDSLAFSQKGIEEPYTPYYYIAGKAGSFQRQSYLGGGIISYNLLKNRLFIGTGIDYLYQTSDRPVDPRSSVTTYQIKFSPTISYKLNQQTFGIGLNIGYGDENISIHYKNDDFQGSLLYPERISKFNFGYGTLETGQANFIRRKTFTGLNVNHHFTTAKWNMYSKISYQISNDDNQYPRAAETNYTFGTYQLESLTAQFLLNKRIGKTDNQLQLNIRKDNGDDHLIRAAARNYTYQGTDINMGYSNYHLSKNNHGIEWMANMDYRKNYQRDAGADHTLSYSYLKPTIGTAIYWKQSNNNRLLTALSLGARLPLKNEISVPLTQVNDFTQGVAYPDYLYWASKVAEAKLKASYTTNKLFQNFRTGISLTAVYLQRLTLPVYEFSPSSIPGKQRMDINCSFNLFF